MRSIKTLFIFIFLLAGEAAFSQSLTVDSPGVVAVGETFQIVYKASAQASSFNSPDFGKLDVLAGPISSTVSSTQIINGKRTDYYEVDYTFTLQAPSVGKYTISAASAVIKGKTYSSGAVTIEAVKGDNNQKKTGSTSISNSDVFLKTTVNKTHVVKGEQISATIKLYTKAPISGFEDIKFPAFNGFWSQDVQTPQSIQFQRESINGKIYDAALIRKYILVPQQSGTLTIDPVEMIAQIQLKSGGGTGNVFDDFFDSYQTVRKRLVSQSVKIVADPIPGNAPKSFTGGVGSLKMNVSLSKDSVNANEAVSVFVSISGTGNINLVEKPALTLPSEFEVYDVKVNDNSKSSASGISGTKQFEFPFIPRNPGKYTIPAIEFTYYDIAKKRYITTMSQPLQLTVGKDVSGGSNSAQTIQPGVSKQDVRILGSDINFIKSGYNLTKGNNFLFGSIIFYIIIILFVFIYYALTKVLKKRIDMRKDVAGLKNRRANKVARARLTKADSLLKQNQYNEFYEELYRAVLGYCSDKLSLNIADLSREKIISEFKYKGISDDLVKQLEEVLDACEYARYSPDSGSGEMDKNYDRAASLISELEAKK